MYEIIIGSLSRQAKGLALLQELLNEEFSLLMERKTEEIMNLEFSIHALLRQLASEKLTVQQSLSGGKLLDYAELLTEPEQKTTINTLWKEIDGLEQNCSRQASLNAELSLALLDQSKSFLTFLHQKVQPANAPNSTYGRSGAYNKQAQTSGALLSGRM